MLTSPTRRLDLHSLLVNLMDPVFRGRYHGRRKHDGQLTYCVTEYFKFNAYFADDFAHMLERSRRAGVVSMIITGGSLSESKLALDIAKEHSTCRSSLYSRWQSVRLVPRSICNYWLSSDEVNRI